MTNEVFIVRPGIGGWKKGGSQANVFSSIDKAMVYWHAYALANPYDSLCVRAVTLDAPGTQRNVNKKERDTALRRLGLTP